MAINFKECDAPGYPVRTHKNVMGTDITLAFAIDFTTPGERITKWACDNWNKLYMPIAFDTSPINLKRSAMSMNSSLKLLMRGRAFDLNIAGNGIYTLAKHGFIQPEIDAYLEAYLEMALNGLKVKEIRSGGQTGIDEAGVKFGDNNGYETICHFPKGWLFRDSFGNDITDKFKFLQRFYLL